MRKVILFVVVYFAAAFSYKAVSADESITLNNESRVESYISAIYSKIDFGPCSKLSYEVFDKAYRGYLNLRSSGKLSMEKEIITICDFSLSSTMNRMWIIDLALKKVLFNTYVAHGQGSGEEFATSFSNHENTHKSSLGFYVTSETYEGEHGTSLRLQGMDEGYNDAAFDRGLVVHGAEYVCDKFVGDNQKLGRSWGCPAVPAKLSLPIIDLIKNGTCLFIYFPDVKYLLSSCWLNKKIMSLPENNTFADVIPTMESGSKPRTKIVQYITNGKIDSVKTFSGAN
jgi:L,D-transpeptidase-like protein